MALDEEGKPAFQELQNRKSTRRPIVFYAFDILHYAGKDLLGLQLRERREVLFSIASSFTDPRRLSPVLEARLPTLWQDLKKAGLEGLVAKRQTRSMNRASAQARGKRSGATCAMCFTLAGIFHGGTNFSELIIGQCRDGKLYYVKRLKAGFVPHTREQVFRAIAALRTKKCPFVNLPKKKGSRSHPLAEELYKEAAPLASRCADAA